MLATRLRPLVVALVVTTILPVYACRTGNPARVSETKRASIPRWKSGASSELITSDEIEKSQAMNAWEVVERTGIFRTDENNDGTPTQLASRRGRSSLYLTSADTPLIVVDGVFVSDFEALRDISAGSIASIELLGWQASTMYYGTNGGAGAIVVTTKASVAGRS